MLYTAGSLTLNVAYAAYNGVLGLFYGSIWFMILGVYYGLLAVMRYMAVSYEKKLDKGIQVVSEVYVMRFTGMMFIVMSVVLMLIELYSMIHNTARQYARLVIASIAVYTVIKLTRAIINLIKVQKTVRRFSVLYETFLLRTQAYPQLLLSARLRYMRYGSAKAIS